MYGHKRHGQTAAITQFGERRVGMGEHIALQSLERLGGKRRLASGIGRLGFEGAGIAIAFENILHRSFGDSKTLGDLSHGLPVLYSRGYDSLAKIDGCWFHGPIIQRSYEKLKCSSG